MRRLGGGREDGTLMRWWRRVSSVLPHFFPESCYALQVSSLARGPHATDPLPTAGTESGGHGPTHQAGQPVLSLIKSLAPAFPPDAVPFLLAAGGIAGSASLPPAFCAGASAVVCGTVLSATSESLLPPKQKELLIAASLDSSIRSGSWDIARDGKNHWPEGVDGRALRNSVF